MKYEYSAGLVPYFIDEQDRKEIKYLLLHYTADHWDFPKGNVEKDEGEIEAAQRELQEETGLVAEFDKYFLQPISYIFKDQKGELVSKKVLFFVGRVHETNVTLSHEHKGYKWLSYREALKQLTYTNARQLLSMARQYIEKQEAKRSATS